MKAYRSILFSGALLGAGLAGADGGDSPLLRLALSPRAAEEAANARLTLPPPVELEIAAWEEAAAAERAEARTFFPHASQVRLDVQTREVNAHELLRREMSRLHGAISVSVDSRGGWETSVELHRNLTPYLQLGVGLSIGRRRGWWDWD